MIKIRYVPPSAPAASQEALEPRASWTQDALTYSPFDAEQLRFSQGTRSKLALEGVGTRGRRKRNVRDSLALSKEWQALSSQAKGGVWQTLQDATTALDKDGQPNINALRQAQRQLRQWFFEQAQAQAVDPATQARAAAVDALLERLIRRNLVAVGAPPAASARGRAIDREAQGQGAKLKAALNKLRPGERSAAALHRKGLALWAAGRTEDAISAFEGAIARSPKSARAHLDLGRLLMDEGHFGEAEWTLLTADELAPKRTDPQLALGELYLEMGQPLLAIQAFKTAVSRNDADTDAHAQLGVVYYEQGDLASATTHLQKALLADQTSVVARFYLAQISLQENDLLRARFQLGMVAKLSPDMDLARFNQTTPPALASRTGGAKTTPLHHWQMPGTTALPRKGHTGGLPSAGTGALAKREGPAEP